MVIATLVVLKRLGAFPTGSQATPAVPPHVRHQQELERQQQQQGQKQADSVLANGKGHASNREAAPTSQATTVSVPTWFTASMKSKRVSSSGGMLTPTAAATSVDGKLKAGMYGVVRSLLRVLEKGVLGKAILDTVLDACSAMQVRTVRGLELQGLHIK